MNDKPKDGRFPAPSCFDEEASEAGWPVPADFDAGRLLDVLTFKLRVTDDAVLAQRLQVTPVIIQMIRAEKLAISPSMMLRWVKSTTGLAAAELLDPAHGPGHA